MRLPELLNHISEPKIRGYIMSEILLKVGALAQMLDLSKRTIHRLNCTGKIPCPVKINGSIRWRQSDIDLWIELGCPDREMFNIRKAG
jgi:predicted DNA-binding transcriptional regulator AlpA